jgi:hypothetical protein
MEGDDIAFGKERVQINRLDAKDFFETGTKMGIAAMTPF